MKYESYVYIMFNNLILYHLVIIIKIDFVYYNNDSFI